MYEHGVMQPGTVYVHAATLNTDSYQKIAATGGIASRSTESEPTCGQGYPPAHQLRKHGIPASLSVDTSVWFSADMFSAMRTTIGADRSLEHYIAHQSGETVTHAVLRRSEERRVGKEGRSGWWGSQYMNEERATLGNETVMRCRD